MARIRTIKPQFFTSEDITALLPLARLLFVGLFTECDREGRLEDRPKTIKMRLLPGDDIDIDGLLWSLADAGLIRRYQADNMRVIQVISFGKHQRPHPKEPPSTLPKEVTEGAAVEKNGEPWKKTAKCRDQVVMLPGDNPSSAVGREGKEYGVKEGNGTEVLHHHPLISKRNLHAEFEHPRFDVPTIWHLQNVKSLSGGDARMRKFYQWLVERVERTNEDTVPRFEWLNRCLKDWLAANAPQISSVPSPEATREMIAEREQKWRESMK